MKNVLATSALVAMLVAPAFAQTAADPTAAPAVSETSGSAEEPMTTEPMAPVATEAAPMSAETAMSAEAPATGFGYTAMAENMSALTFIGKRLYVSEIDVDINAEMTELDQEWDDVGEISDIVLSKDGKVEAILVDIGGFLGMGEKSVAVPMDHLKVIKDGDSENDYFVVFKSDRGALEAAPEFEWPKAS